MVISRGPEITELLDDDFGGHGDHPQQMRPDEHGFGLTVEADVQPVPVAAASATGHDTPHAQPGRQRPELFGDADLLDTAPVIDVSAPIIAPMVVGRFRSTHDAVPAARQLMHNDPDGPLGVGRNRRWVHTKPGAVHDAPSQLPQRPPAGAVRLAANTSVPQRAR
jgi:hypothetical protein